MRTSPKVILIVDDDLDDQEMLEEALSSIGPDLIIDKVTTGKDLVHYLKNCHETWPDLLVLDYNLPDTAGPKLLSYLKNAEILKTIPAIIWSTSDLPDHVGECLNVGAKAYFVKPYTQKAIVEIAEKILRFL